MKKLISGIIAAVLVFTAVPFAKAADDISNHWAKEYITYLSQHEIMRPSSDGSYKPDQAVTRAEFMRYINRAFNFTQKSAINFNDVAQYDASGAEVWYYEPVQVAVAHGYITGMGNNNMSPGGTLTREQAATIIGRLHKIEASGSASSLTFSDKSKIQTYAVGYIAEAVDNGYLSGYPNGSFQPQGEITRAEMAKLLYYYMGTRLGTSGTTYTQSSLINDITVLNASITAPATLKGTTIKGDLYITEGVLGQSVELTDVTVEGKIIASGGDLWLENVNAPQLVVSTPLGNAITITASGDTNIGKTEVQTAATLYESGLSSSAGGFSDVVLNGDSTPAVTITADVWELHVKKAATVTTSSISSINQLVADAAVTVKGTGSIQTAKLNANGCVLDVEPAVYTLGSGVVAQIAGTSTSSSHAVVISPATFEYDISSDKLDNHVEYATSVSTDKLVSIKNNGKALTEGTHYRAVSGGFRLYAAYVETLDEGTHTLLATWEDGTSGVLTITVKNSSKNTVGIKEATFNKYTDSLDYANITVPISLASGVTLNSVKIGTTTLTRGSDYTYNQSEGIVVLLRSMLENLNTGSSTVTFNTSKGASPTMTLYIEDASPVNSLSVTSVDFDANTSSGGYQDISVELTAADGATLEYIICNGTKLDLDWHYRTSGTTVTLSKAAVASFATGGAQYADFRFVMTTGRTPVLTVNYVTTFAVKVTVVDDLGAKLEGINVQVTPTGDTVKEGSASQTVQTNSEGIATAYVQRGTYTVTVTGDKFEESLTRSVTVNGQQSLNMTAKIMETVKINVTNTNGAKLSGASVYLDNQTVVTGADGVAEFQVARGTYPVRVTCSGYSAGSESITVNSAATYRIILSAN